jgi:hypothetical protein
MSPDQFRQAALSIPGASESSHLNHPDFRIEGKIFATLGYPDGGWGMVKLTPEQQKRLVGLAPDVFLPAKGAWGQKGSTNVHLASVELRLLRSALVLAAGNLTGMAEKP